MPRVTVVAAKKKFNKMARAVKINAQKLSAAAAHKSFFEVYLVDRTFMNKNVLAFRAAHKFPRPDVPGKFLGEIYLNPEYIKKHREDIRLMLVHGFAHLLGYDHKNKGDRIRMENKVGKLLKLLIS